MRFSPAWYVMCTVGFSRRVLRFKYFVEVQSVNKEKNSEERTWEK